VWAPSLKSHLNTQLMGETWSGNLPPSKCQVPITAGWTGVGMMLGG